MNTSDASSPGQQELQNIQDTNEMTRLLDLAVAGRVPITVHLQNEDQAFFTTLSTPTREDGEAMHQGAYLLTTLLGPYDGNTHIRQSHGVSLRFCVEQTQIQLDTTFLGDVGGRFLKLAFPKVLQARQQRRTTPRLNTPKSLDLQVTVITGTGERFTAKMRDISRGGVSFCTASSRAPALSRVPARLRLETSPLAHCEFDVGIFENRQRKDSLCYRAYFMANGATERKHIEELVDYVASRTQGEVESP